MSEVERFNEYTWGLLRMSTGSTSDMQTTTP
ncbi:Uncharacterised protein [Pseudomonas aeruginosa]|nr:Uncharacterised protein [Pseudomonas aeruginosa]